VRRALLALVAATLAFALAGCGESAPVSEPDLVVAGQVVTTAPSPESTPARGRLRVATTRLAFVSHGQASDPFWSIVKKGVDDAARRTGVAVSYRAPDTYDVERMAQMIDEAASAHLDGLVVSLPDVEALAPAIRRAEQSGVPVVSINSGSDRFRSLGVLAHVGQPEYQAGLAAGRRLAKAGVRNVLCVNQEVGNAGLDERCRGVNAAMERAGGAARVLGIDVQDQVQARRRIAQAVTSAGADGIITLGPGGADPALAAVRAAGLEFDVELATFDLSPDVIEAVRDRRMLFAVDQQPYLQGYLPIVMLAERARHLLFPARGKLIPTGPEFVTPKNAASVLELSRRGFR
jgi:simple sugar transport system substrate-binding protein